MDVTIEGVTKAFGDVLALDNLSAHVKSGEYYAILGHTGSGKTTLLRIVAGLDRADKGNVLLDLVPRQKIPVGSGDIQLVFQDFALWPHMTVFENLSFPLKQRKLKDKDIVGRVEDMSVRMDIAPRLLRRLPSQLSEGQKQQIAIARAIITNPKLLLLDEPFAHLDPITKLKIRRDILKMQAEQGMTIVMVTHQLSDAMALADRIAVMRDGHVLQVSTPEDLVQTSSNEYVSAYIQSYSILPRRK